MKTTIQVVLVSVIALSAVVLLSQSVVAAKNSNNTRPGNGFGDTNHEHTGPPGQSVRAHNGN